MDDALSAVSAGAVGTVVTGGIFFLTELTAGFGAHVFRTLSELLLIGTSGSIVVGLALFVVGGAIVWPLLYITLGRYLPGMGPNRGLVFGTILWIAFVPAFAGGTVGAALPAFAGDTNASLVIYLVVTLIVHLIYGAILGGGHARFSDQSY